MSFEWQNIDQAANTLEVDLDTLRKWIDEGQAPSRDKNGVMQVLIEFPDDDDTDDNATPEQTHTENQNDEPEIIDGEYEEITPESEQPPTFAIQQSHQREMQ